MEERPFVVRDFCRFILDKDVLKNIQKGEIKVAYSTIIYKMLESAERYGKLSYSESIRLINEIQKYIDEKYPNLYYLVKYKPEEQIKGLKELTKALSECALKRLI